MGDSRIERLTETFGANVVFIPLIKGSKRPTEEGYTNFTIEKMNEVGYCSQLEAGNIAILVGPNSGHLVSIDFDDDAAFEEFASLNPELSKTLQTFGARGRNLWFRMTGEYLATVIKLRNGKDEEVGEWRAGGGVTIVDGVHPEGMEYRIDGEFPVRTISSKDISWPEDWQKYPGKRDPSEILQERFGPPCSEGSNGGVQLNESFVAGWIECEVRIAYAKELKQFVRYSEKDGIWKRLVDQEVDGLISDYIGRLASECGLESLHFKKKSTVIRSIKVLLEAGTVSSFLRPASWKGVCQVAAANEVVGVVEPTEEGLTAQICPLNCFSPHFYLLGKSEVPYEEGAVCPRFLEDLLRPVLDPEDVVLLQKMYGLILLGRNDLQKILLLEGAGDLGKGVATRVLDSVLGRALVTELRTEHLRGRFELSRFLGKRLLAGRDVSSDFLKSPGASMLKALTGGDLLSSETKNASAFEDLVGDFHVVITSNSPLLLRIDEDSTAWVRRLVIIPFRTPIDGLPKRILNFEAILLRDEGPGILNWMLEGAQIALTEIHEHGTIVLSPTQKARVSDRVRVSNTVNFFVEDGLMLVPDHCISSQHLLEAYQRFCADKALSVENDRVFQMRVKSLIENRFEGSVRYSENIPSLGGGSHVRGYRGLALAKW